MQMWSLAVVFIMFMFSHTVTVAISGTDGLKPATCRRWQDRVRYGTYYICYLYVVHTTYYILHSA